VLTRRLLALLNRHHAKLYTASRRRNQDVDLPRYIKISSLVHLLRGKTFIPTFETLRQRELGDGAPEQP
jgi:hypothetical protein